MRVDITCIVLILGELQEGTYRRCRTIQESRAIRCTRWLLPEGTGDHGPSRRHAPVSLSENHCPALSTYESGPPSLSPPRPHATHPARFGTPQLVSPCTSYPHFFPEPLPPTSKHMWQRGFLAACTLLHSLCPFHPLQAPLPFHSYLSLLPSTASFLTLRVPSSVPFSHTPLR